LLSAKLFMRREKPKPKIVESFGHAFRGIRWVLSSEPNFRIHLAGVVAVVIFGFVLSVSRGEWLALILASGIVLISEILNTAVEYLADALHPEHHPKIGKAKDAAAAAVLISSLAALVVGVIVFIPKLWNLF